MTFLTDLLAFLAASALDDLLGWIVPTEGWPASALGSARERRCPRR